MKISKLLLTLAAFGFLGTALVFQGCGKSSKSKAGTAAAAQAASNSDKEDDEDSGDDESPAGDSKGQSSIAFYNNFLGFRNVSQSTFQAIDKALEKGEEFIGRNTGDARPDWNSVITPTSQITKIPGYKFSAPADFSSKDKDYINPRIETVKKDVAALLKEIEAMKKYYKAEDYKDDWHKAYLMAKPRIVDLMNKIAKNNKEVYKLADKISEDIDRKNIAGRKDGVFILNMRYMIDKAVERADLILENDFADTRYGCGVSPEEKAEMVKKAAPICDKFDALTKQLDEMCAKYKDIDKGVIKGTSAAKTYDSFFTSYESSSDEMRRIIRDLRERGYTNDQNNVSRAVGGLIKAHNEFNK